MQRVQKELGDDAIIITTREEAGGVKITAAVEQETSPPPPEKPKAASKAKTQPKEKKEETDTATYDHDTIMEMITDLMLKHRVPGTVSERIISTAMTLPGRDPQKMLSAALKKTFVFEPALLPSKKRKPLMLVGPPGAGKTLMTAKLAARAVLSDDIKPTVITTDIARAGGVEQLSSFLNILNLPLLQAEDAKSLKSALARAEGDVIIDTGGLNPFDPQEMKALARLIAVHDMETALVLPAGIDAEESAEIALTFEILGVNRLIPTRLDFARRLGGLLSAAERAKLSFSDSSHTPQVADGILTLTPDALAALLMPRSAKKR